MSLDQGLRTEGLWRLDESQLLPGKGFDHPSPSDAFHRVRTRYHRHDTIEAGQSPQHAMKQVGRRERTSGVVAEHRVRFAPERLQPAANGRYPRVAADSNLEAAPRDDRFGPALRRVGVPIRDEDDDAIDLRARRDGPVGVEEHRGPGKLDETLGLAAQAVPRARGEQQSEGCSHGWKRIGSSRAAAGGALSPRGWAGPRPRRPPRGRRSTVPCWSEERWSP